MSDPVRVALIGAGGYGYHYARALLDDCPTEMAELVAIVDPRVGHPGLAAELRERRIPSVTSTRSYFASAPGVDLAVVVSPIHLHVPHSVQALAHGCHVLCDKPLGATVQDADELMTARDAARRQVRIGYQWSYSPGIQRLKRDILAGRFGAPTRARTLCFWPRDLRYYRRNDWAGRLRDPESGRWILDSPFNNAQAHFIHNLLYLLGPAPDRSAQPVAVQGEAGRRFPIESIDTVVCRVETDAGCEILFVGSHATGEQAGPTFELEFDRARVSYAAERSGAPGRMTAELAGGGTVSYPSPDTDAQFHKLFEAIRSVREAEPVLCGPEAARAQTLCANGLHESLQEIAPVTDRVGGDLRRCYEARRLPSELGLGWSASGWRVPLSGYRRFPADAAEPAG